ncbi:MAG: 23S rRNA (pseudouridine(1915)-N(3))-methyltransferase RlmH [Oscillibacter sp.]|nr:23S rRNA (pseudouridine(1915)-N(3))-methyltransferase RlmH [Oscillibacter sp.]
MQKITVLCVGKWKEKFFEDAAAEYLKRLSRFCRAELVQLPETRLPDAPSQSQIDAALESEAEAILAKTPAQCRLIALCVEGKPYSSEDFSALLDPAEAGHVAFLVGGSYGLHPSVKARADARVSMSPMTFPHHLARVMLLEQIYRAFQIRAGSRYHK